VRVRAARLHELSGTPVVGEVDPPRTADALRISAAALNPVDISIGSGRFYSETPPLPYVIGSEAIGRTAAGARVWLRGRGLMAELVEAPDWMFDVPDGLSDSLALACGVAGLTAWLAITWRAPVGPEDTVLVLGASGVLGATALQGATLLGARRVIGVARRTERIPACADEVVDLAQDELPQATLIVDALWGEPLELALAAAAPGVRIVHLGQSAGPAATLLSAWVRGKSASILGHSLFAVPAERAAAGYAELCEHARAGRIEFEVERYPLDEVAAAWRRQASGSPGAKIVVELE
jgi:NADPH:quinone reductase-like Zn-dependent oxidoreductase